MEKEDTNWFKKHVDTIVVLAGILGATMWMTSKINEIEKDIAVMKAVLVMKNIMPSELAKCEKDKE